MDRPHYILPLLSLLLSYIITVSSARNVTDSNWLKQFPFSETDIESPSSSHRRSVAERITALCQGYPGDAPSHSLLPRFVSNGRKISTVAAWKSNGQVSISLQKTGNLNYVVVTNRKRTEDGPLISPLFLAAGTYKLSGWIKLNSQRTKESTVRVTLATQSGGARSLVAVALGKVGCWTLLEGGFSVIKKAKRAVLGVEGPPGGVGMFLRSFSLEPVVADSWRKSQNKRIDQIRKRDVKLQVILPNGKPANGAWLDLTQKVSDFPFGAAVSGAFAKSRTWQQWHAKRFKWAVLENEMKWYTNERWPGDQNFDDADRVMKVLEKMEQNVRGHCIFWEDVNYVQGWVQQLSKPDLIAAVQQRLATIVNRYKGRLKHWDVNNELLHGSFYEDAINKTITSWMFRETHRLDPRVQTVFNDYNLIEEYRDKGASGELAVRALQELQRQGAQVQIMGSQSHFRNIPNAPRIKAELDVLQTGGIPVWITELSIWEDDPFVQANYFEVVMREVFSHPAVEGIMQWEVARPPCNLWRGIDAGKCLTKCTTCFVDENWRDRPIGERYVRLRKEWSTHVKRHLDGYGSINFRGFFGKYRARIKYQGKLYERYFDVPKGRDLTTVRLSLRN